MVAFYFCFWCCHYHICTSIVGRLLTSISSVILVKCRDFTTSRLQPLCSTLYVIHYSQRILEAWLLTDLLSKPKVNFTFSLYFKEEIEFTSVRRQKVGKVIEFCDFKFDFLRRNVDIETWNFAQFQRLYFTNLISSRVLNNNYLVVNEVRSFTAHSRI